MVQNLPDLKTSKLLSTQIVLRDLLYKKKTTTERYLSPAKTMFNKMRYTQTKGMYAIKQPTSTNNDFKQDDINLIEESSVVCKQCCRRMLENVLQRVETAPNVVS